MKIQYTNEIIMNIMTAVIAHHLSDPDVEYCEIVQQSTDDHTVVNFSLVLPKNDDAKDFSVATGDDTEINMEGF